MSELTNELRGEANGSRAMGDHGNAEMLDRTADRIDKLEECLRDFLAEHDNAAIEQPDAKTLILYWARNNDMVTKARALLEEK